MADKQYKDKAGRPVVAITGMGVITSLGTGKEDNWKKLTAGKSGIRKITRFPTDALRTTIAGTVNEGYEPKISPSVIPSASRKSSAKKQYPNPASGRKGISRPDVPRDGADRA